MAKCSQCGKGGFLYSNYADGLCKKCYQQLCVASAVPNSCNTLNKSYKFTPFSQSFINGYTAPDGSFCNYSKYLVYYKKPDATRKSSKTIYAKSEDTARSKAIADGIDPISVSMSKPSGVSAGQDPYASKLGISYPANITCNDLSAIITRVEDFDIWPTNKHLAYYADQCGLLFSRFHGNKYLMRIVYDYNQADYRKLVDKYQALQMFDFTNTTLDDDGDLEDLDD